MTGADERIAAIRARADARHQLFKDLPANYPDGLAEQLHLLAALDEARAEARSAIADMGTVRARLREQRDEARARADRLTAADPELIEAAYNEGWSDAQLGAPHRYTGKEPM